MYSSSHLVYKVTAALEMGSPFFVFRESRVFATPTVAASWFAGGCSTARWWMLGKQGCRPKSALAA